MVALEQKSAWKGCQVDTEQQSNLLWKLSKTLNGASNSSAQIFKEKLNPVYLVWNSSMQCNSHQQLCTATRGIAGPLINFKERKYLKEKKKHDGKGAGQDFTHPYLLMEGCSWISQTQSPWSYKQLLYLSGKLRLKLELIYDSLTKLWQTLGTSLPAQVPLLYALNNYEPVQDTFQNGTVTSKGSSN